jgi:hypothetical protein
MLYDVCGLEIRYVRVQRVLVACNVRDLFKIDDSILQRTVIMVAWGEKAINKHFLLPFNCSIRLNKTDVLNF